LRKPLAETID